jgi:DNA-binding IclR family transcriptional regulator
MSFTDLPENQAVPVPSAARTGTQALSRGIKLMRMIASRPQSGWRLSDLATACDQDKATVHRMLACLVEERLVEQREADRRYMPGPLMYELGLALPSHAQFQQRVEVLIQNCARRMSGIVLFMVRSGNEYVCSARAGTLPLAGLMVYPGTRRPLFTSAGGVAILQTLPADEAREILLDNVEQEIKSHGTVRLEVLQKMREDSDMHGFGVNRGIVVPGVYAFGMPVRNKQDAAFASLCLVGTPELYDAVALETLRESLQSTAGEVEDAARHFGI